MKHLFKFLILLLLAWPGLAQVANQELKPIAREIVKRTSDNVTFTDQDGLFKLKTNESKRTASEVKDVSVLELQPQTLKEIFKRKEKNLNLKFPTIKGKLELQLYEVDIFSEGFSMVTSDGKVYDRGNAKHYRGIIKGDNQSLAAISIFENEVMGLVVNNLGNHVLGKKGKTGNEYVYYNDQNLEGVTPLECHTTAAHIKAPIVEGPPDNARIAATRCVRLYWEADYPIFQNKGSVTNVNNFLQGLFNQSKIIFDNDGISITLQQIFVWTSPSPYTAAGSGKLDQFRTFRTSFNGDVAHLLHFGGGGGVAYLNTVCVPGWNYAASGIDPSHSNYPTFSWNVMVVTHEQGHSFGSQHTHECVWNGNNTAIDHCGGNSCPATEPVPSGGGTIMSYCHLTSTGINLTKGFGPLPKARITNTLNAKTCVNASCSTPVATITNNAVYRIAARHSGLVADVNNASTENNGNVIQWANNGGTNQHWRAISLAGGYWRFVNIRSGRSLTVQNNSLENGGDIIQYDWSGGNNQQWAVSSAGGEFFYLTNRLSNRVMDVSGLSTANGANIHQWQLTNGTNQQWRFDLVAAASPSATLASTEENKSNKILLIPNPANSEVKVIFYADREELVEIGFLNSSGQKVHTVTKEALKGRNETLIAIPSQVKSGLYLIDIEGNRSKLIIQK